MKKLGSYYKYLSGVFDTVASYYGYVFTLNNEDYDKYYYIKDNEIIFKSCIDNALVDAEIISLLYRTIEEIGLDMNININTNDKDLMEYLAYLDVDYEISDIPLNNNKLVFNGIIDDELVASGYKNDTEISFKLDLFKVLELLRDNSKLNENNIDVYVAGVTLEEKMTLVRLVQDIRWSEVKVGYNTNNKDLDYQLEEANGLGARLVLILNNDDLQKGLIKVLDNYIKEELMIDEAEILDYIVSNL